MADTLGAVTSTGWVAVASGASPGSLVAGGASATSLWRATVSEADDDAGEGDVVEGAVEPPVGGMGGAVGRAGEPPGPSSGSSLAAYRSASVSSGSLPVRATSTDVRRGPRNASTFDAVPPIPAGSRNGGGSGRAFSVAWLIAAAGLERNASVGTERLTSG